MKRIFCVFCFCISITVLTEDDSSVILKNAVLHPLLRDCFRENKLILKGGYYLKHIDNEHYILIGVGRGPLNKGLLNAFKLAKANAEVEISKILNAMEVDVKTARTIQASITKEKPVKSQHYKKCTMLLLQAQTVNIQSAGFWIEGSSFFYVQAVFAGDFRKNTLSPSTWLDRVTGAAVTQKRHEIWMDVLAKYPWLQLGGCAVAVGPEGKDYLLVVAACEDTLPSDKMRSALRIKAASSALAFSQGNKMTYTLRRIREHWKDNDGSGNTSWKKKFADFQVHSWMMAEEEPVITWKNPDYGIVLGLFIYQDVRREPRNNFRQ